MSGGTGRCGDPNEYTLSESVFAHTKWIKKTIKTWNQKTITFLELKVKGTIFFERSAE